MENSLNNNNLIVRLTYPQLQSLSEITADIGQAIFASVIIPFAFGLDRIDALIVIFGLITAMFFWTLSIYLTGKRR